MPADLAAARLRVQAATLAAAQVEVQTEVSAVGLEPVLRADLVAAPLAPRVEAQEGVLAPERVVALAAARPVVQTEPLVAVQAAGPERVLREILMVAPQVVRAEPLA